MSGRLRDLYPPSPLVHFRVYGSKAARRVATPPPTRTSVNPVSPAVPRGEPDRHRATSGPRRSCPGTASGAPKRRGSQKWEPTCSAALRHSTTRSDSSRRSMARSSTQSDSDRQLKRLRNSLTRKRSLVQIQYGPPGISCSWPYQVALCGPTTALRRALPRRSSGQVRSRELARRPRRANGTWPPDDGDPDVNTLFSTVQHDTACDAQLS